MGFMDGLKAGFLAGFGVDYYSQKSSQSLDAIQQQGRAVVASAAASDQRQIEEFTRRLQTVERVLMVDWPSALATNDLGTMQVTATRSLPVLNAMSDFLGRSDAVFDILDADAYVDLTDALIEYILAAEAWMAADVTSATAHMAEGLRAWDRVADFLDAMVAA